MPLNRQQVHLLRLFTTIIAASTQMTGTGEVAQQLVASPSEAPTAAAVASVRFRMFRTMLGGGKIMKKVNKMSLETMKFNK